MKSGVIFLKNLENHEKWCHFFLKIWKIMKSGVIFKEFQHETCLNGLGKTLIISVIDGPSDEIHNPLVGFFLQKTYELSHPVPVR